jgi:hypothetical protein
VRHLHHPRFPALSPHLPGRAADRRLDDFIEDLGAFIRTQRGAVPIGLVLTKANEQYARYLAYLEQPPEASPAPLLTLPAAECG